MGAGQWVGSLAAWFSMLQSQCSEEGFQCGWHDVARIAVGVLALNRTGEFKQGEEGICMAGGSMQVAGTWKGRCRHGLCRLTWVSEPTSDEGFCAVGASHSLVCCVREPEESTSA